MKSNITNHDFLIILVSNLYKNFLHCVGRVYENMIGYPAMYKWKADVWKHFND